MITEEKQKSRGQSFVVYALGRMEKDHAFGAALRRADNPATEYQSWEYLAGFKVDLEKPWERQAFTTIGAALCRAKPTHSGSFGLGQSLFHCYESDAVDQGKAKLRRVLACDTSEEVCQVLRPLLSLIASRPKTNLSYGRLLDDLLWFDIDPQKVKVRWAQDFFGRQAEE